jgi:hypothetical protein
MEVVGAWRATMPELVTLSPCLTRPLAMSSPYRRSRVPARPGRSWHKAYNFGYHNATGQYKVVQVPCFVKTKETLNMFMLGEAS